MKTYKVEYREVVLYEFYVDAETKDEAAEKLFNMMCESELDFSDGFISESEITNIEEV
jgi:hypothetical protein